MYHLLFDLGEWLDGRVWPKSDELDVLRLMDLIRHVTGAGPPPPELGCPSARHEPATWAHTHQNNVPASCFGSLSRMVMLQPSQLCRSSGHNGDTFTCACAHIHPRACAQVEQVRMRSSPF